MAMEAQLFLATAEQVEKLVANPASISEFTSKTEYGTPYFTTINYFTYGDAWEGDALLGTEQIECSAMETGNFGIVKPAHVAKVLAKLEKLDLKKLAKQVEDADPDKLAEAEVDDVELELLAGGDETAGETLVDEVKNLIAFYKKVAKAKAGVVMYTS